MLILHHEEEEWAAWTCDRLAFMVRFS
jgi:hypothetical protein